MHMSVLSNFCSIPFFTLYFVRVEDKNGGQIFLFKSSCYALFHWLFTFNLFLFWCRNRRNAKAWGQGSECVFTIRNPWYDKMIPKVLHMKFDFNRPSGVRDVWKCEQQSLTILCAHLCAECIDELIMRLPSSNPLFLIIWLEIYMILGKVFYRQT